MTGEWAELMQLIGVNVTIVCGIWVCRSVWVFFMGEPIETEEDRRRQSYLDRY